MAISGKNVPGRRKNNMQGPRIFEGLTGGHCAWSVEGKGENKGWSQPAGKEGTRCVGPGRPLSMT